MSRIQIPIDILTSRLNLSDRFAGMRSQSLTSRFANLKPISEFFDLKRLSKPANFGEVQSRVNYNLSHFSSNYFVVFLMLSIYSLLTNWVLLFDILLVVGGMWGIGKLEGRDLEVGTMKATSSQLYTALLIVAVPLGFFRGGGLGGRPRSPKVVPPWGRPSGAKGASRRRKQWGWEEQQARVEELDSDDTDTQGVGLGGKEKRFVSDPLQFIGTDLASARVRRSYIIDDSEGSSSDSEESEVEGTDALQIALREKEEALVQSALKRIRRAQEKGKTEVKLNQDELDALENRRKRMQAAATTKARKGSGSSNGSGSEKKRRSDRNIVIPLAPQEDQIRSSSRPTSSRRSSKGKSRRADELPTTSTAPAFMIAGADGLTYAPMSTSQQPSPNRNSTSRPRASTNSQLARGGGPAPYYPFQAGNPRHVPDNMRPASSASNRSRPMPDEEGWIPTNSRRSSGASSYVVDPFEYQVSSDAPPPIPAQYMQPQSHSQPGRRAVSGPQDVSYSSVRRSLPPGASFQPPHARGPIPDPFSYRQRSDRDELGQEYYSSSEDDSDDLGNGVQVFVDEREADRERERALVSVPRKPVGGGKKNRKR